MRGDSMRKNRGSRMRNFRFARFPPEGQCKLLRTPFVGSSVSPTIGTRYGVREDLLPVAHMSAWTRPTVFHNCITLEGSGA
jgi:hypothetical protein